MSVLACAGTARADEKRPVPDYDGRPERTTVGDVAAWVPRVLAAPLYLTAEFVLRRPLGAITKSAESAGETPKSKWTFSPIVVADAGFRPWFGLHVKRDDVFSEDNSVHAQAAFGGVHTLLLGLADETILGDRAALSIYGAITRRDDAIFHGLGPRTSPDSRVRYGFDRLETGLAFRILLGRSSELHSMIGVRATRFTDPRELSTRDYGLVLQGAALTLDSRHDPLLPSTALRFDVDAEHAIDTAADRHARFVKWGGALTLSLDLTGKQRMLSLSVAARFVDTLSGNVPPVTELVVLGGDRYLRGHLFGRLVGESAFVTALTYEWPIWVWLDGFITAEAGDVFGTHLAGFAPRLLRTSYTVGMRAPAGGATVELLGGVGTETIEDGLRISAGRLLFVLTRSL